MPSCTTCNTGLTYDGGTWTELPLGSVYNAVYAPYGTPIAPVAAVVPVSPVVGPVIPSAVRYTSIDPPRVDAGCAIEQMRLCDYTFAEEGPRKECVERIRATNLDGIYLPPAETAAEAYADYAVRSCPLQVPQLR